MTEGEVRDYLMTARTIDGRIASLRAEQNALRMSLLPVGIRYDNDRVQTSPSDTMAEMEVKIDEIECDICDLIDQRARFVVEAIDNVRRLQDVEEQTVLISYYFEHCGVNRIAKNMFRSRRSVYDVKDRAVRNLCSFL